MEERESDTQKTFGDQAPPGDHSNQNMEEPSAPGGGQGGSQEGAGDRESSEDPGSAKEGGQSTGHPDNAG